MTKFTATRNGFSVFPESWRQAERQDLRTSRQALSPGVSLGSGKVGYTEDNQHRRPCPSLQDVSQQQRNKSVSLFIILAKLRKTETRNPHWTYSSTCYLYLSLDRYLLNHESTIHLGSEVLETNVNEQCRPWGISSNIATCKQHGPKPGRVTTECPCSRNMWIKKKKRMVAPKNPKKWGSYSLQDPNSISYWPYRRGQR